MKLKFHSGISLFLWQEEVKDLEIHPNQLIITSPEGQVTKIRGLQNLFSLNDHQQLSKPSEPLSSSSYSQIPDKLDASLASTADTLDFVPSLKNEKHLIEELLRDIEFFKKSVAESYADLEKKQTGLSEKHKAFEIENTDLKEKLCEMDNIVFTYGENFAALAESVANFLLSQEEGSPRIQDKKKRRDKKDELGAKKIPEDDLLR